MNETEFCYWIRSQTEPSKRFPISPHEIRLKSYYEITHTAGFMTETALIFIKHA